MGWGAAGGRAGRAVDPAYSEAGPLHGKRDWVLRWKHLISDKSMFKVIVIHRFGCAFSDSSVIQPRLCIPPKWLLFKKGMII